MGAHHYTQTYRKKLQLQGDGSQSPRGTEREGHVRRGTSPNASSENVRAALQSPDVDESTSPRFGLNSPLRRAPPKDMISLNMASTEEASPRGKKHNEFFTHATHYFLNGEVHLKSDQPIEEKPPRRHYRVAEYSPNWRVSSADRSQVHGKLTSNLSSEAHNHRYKDPGSPVPHCRKMFPEKLETRSADEKDRWEIGLTRKMKGAGSPSAHSPKRDLEEGVSDLLNMHGAQELVAERERRIVEDSTFKRACEINSKYSKAAMNLSDAISFENNKTNSSNVANCLNWP